MRFVLILTLLLCEGCATWPIIKAGAETFVLGTNVIIGAVKLKELTAPKEKGGDTMACGKGKKKK